MSGMPKWSPKNPLEVIAIFIALIYGICALLLGSTVSGLEKINQTIMVWFIVLFPVAVLVVFAWLVRNHHKKLYAPGDYRSDDAFHGNQAASDDLGARLQSSETIDSQDDSLGEATAAVTGSDIDTAVEISERPTETVSAPPASNSIADLYLAEGLAFQELQKEFDAAVRRHLQVPAVGGGLTVVDGILETKSGTAFVEVKVIRRLGDLARRVREVFASLEKINLMAYDGTPLLVAVFVVADDVVTPLLAKHLRKFQMMSKANIEVRIFSVATLKRKYGL
ncbi:hypothetical protein [Brevundimonas subvibrioides]|uniref:hypothetical protein n=1 Tax=Brevundimonas subvibrioides TaxID=74313 RepID=UPI0022B43A0E|nr:hypothetical protein [Brevundimonas subvibrioides]